MFAQWIWVSMWSCIVVLIWWLMIRVFVATWNICSHIGERMDLLGGASIKGGFGWHVATPGSEEGMDSIKWKERPSAICTWCWAPTLLNHNWAQGYWNFFCISQATKGILSDLQHLQIWESSSSWAAVSLLLCWLVHCTIVDYKHNLWWSDFVQAVAEITVARHFADRGVSSVSSLSLSLKKFQA